MLQVFIFYEHALGCALFELPKFDNWESFNAQIKEHIFNIDAFHQLIRLVAFLPFNGREALEYMNNCSEGILTENIQHFLGSNLPKPKKRGPVTLLVQDAKLTGVISETLCVNCATNKEMIEIVRGIRVHFCNLVPGVKNMIACKAQLALGHHCARAKVKFNMNRIDNNVIQSISLIDQMEKDINTFSMRVRDWYSYHFPELTKVVSDNHLFVRCVNVVRNRKDMNKNIQEQLTTILGDDGKAQNIVELARTSMGMDIASYDMENIIEFANRVNSLIIHRNELIDYLKLKMHDVAPNLAVLIGETVGARLIAHAGSLINLAKFPSSTIQVLGAEKALFRAIKSHGKTPKYGILYNSSFIGKAAKGEKGKIARYVANKCSTASRIDCFREFPTQVFGSKLKQQVKDRFQNYAARKFLCKNTDIMEEALNEANVEVAALAKAKRMAEKKEKKKQQSQSLREMSETSSDAISATKQRDSEENLVSPEKKKKRKKESVEGSEIGVSPQKKRLSGEVQEAQATKEQKQAEEEMQVADPEVRKKVKKAKQEKRMQVDVIGAPTESTSTSANDLESALPRNVVDATIKKKKKKKKKKHQEE